MIMELLDQRAKISIEVGRIKDEQGLNIYDPSRESMVYDYLTEINGGAIPDGALKNIFREIISACRALQAQTTVAYLGPETSFTHLAAQSHFGKSVIGFPQSSISDVFDEVEKEKIQWGVVPIENSSEGSINLTMDRLISTPLSIRAEIFLRITHSLLSAGKETGMIKRVYSHPQALAQCQSWLRKNLPHCSLYETESTAAAARKVTENKECAAIGSSLAARIYGLNTIAEGIEDSPFNTTRFLIIGNGESRPSGRDKTSILFGTSHTPGALYKSMGPFARENINLMKIESYPMKGRMWEYLFFVDFAGHKEDSRVKICLADLKKLSSFMKILGSYPNGGK
jgi:chorismate mutase/prephenate dehydratase